MTKSDGVERIARLQAQIHRLTQYRLTMLHRRQAELQQAEREAVAWLDGDASVAAIAQRRLRAIAMELRGIVDDIATQARLLAEQARRARTAENVATRLSMEAANLDERKQLGEIVADIAARGAARLP